MAMKGLYDYKKFAVLYVDDEEKSLKYFTRAFEEQSRILTAANALDGLKLLEEHKDDLGLLITDQRMPGEKGVWLLEKARQLRPRIIRMLATGLSHHIRNSLVAVKTFLDLAPSKLKEEDLDLDTLRNPDFWKEYYQNVQGQIAKINQMLKDLWTASENPAFAFNDQVRLDEVISGAVERLKESFAAKNIRVEMDLPGALPALTVDKTKFVRLFELLLKDEVVSLPPGSQITLSARPGPEVVAPPTEIQVQIRDNGPGLPQDALRLIV